VLNPCPVLLSYCPPPNAFLWLYNRYSLMKITPIVLAATLLSGAASAADLTAVPSGMYQVDTTHAYIRFQYNHLGLSNPTLGFEEFTQARKSGTITSPVANGLMRPTARISPLTVPRCQLTMMALLTLPVI